MRIDCGELVCSLVWASINGAFTPNLFSSCLISYKAYVINWVDANLHLATQMEANLYSQVKI